MAETARLAVFHGAGKPFEIREYPVPDPEPGAMLIKVALANVCGSDLHYWRGEQDYVKMGRPLPLNTGHEHVGTVAKLGPGVTTDSTGRPLTIGDRVLYRFFFPCGRCKLPAAPVQVVPRAPGQLARLVRGVAPLPGRLRPVLLPAPESRGVQAGRRDHRRDGGRHQLRIHAGLCGARDRRSSAPGKRWSSRARAGSASTRAPWRGRWARPGRRHRRARRAARAGEARSAPPTSSTCARTRRPTTRIAAVKKLTDDWGGDVVLELVGHPGVVDEGLRMTAPEGTYLEIGNINVGWKAEFDPSWIIFGNRRIIGLAHYEAEHLRGALDLMRRTLTQVSRGGGWSPTSSRSRRSTRPSPSRTRATSPARRSSRTERPGVRPHIPTFPR